MRLSIAFLILSFTLAVMTASPPSWAGSRTLARVDGEPITGENLKEAFGAQHMGHTSFLAGEIEVRKALDSLIDRTLLLHEAERMDLGNQPEIQAGVEERLSRLSVKHLLKLEVEDAAQPTEAEIRAIHDQYTDHLLKVRQIVVPDRAGIDEIAARLERGEPFADLAKENSRVKSAQADGLMPHIGWGTMEAAWDEVAFRLEPGAISKPFASGGAWEILLLEERVPVERPEYASARSRIHGILLRRGLDQKERDLSTRLLKKYGVAVKLTPLEPEIYKAALERDPETVVATWKGGNLHVRELAERIDFAGMEKLTAQQASREIEDLVRTSVTKPLLHLEARARKYDQLPDVLAAARAYREEAMLAQLHNSFIFKDLTLTDAEVRLWYDSHPDEVRSPEKRFVSQILVKTEEEARAARQRLSEGVPFADLAREISIDVESAPKGGALGSFTKKESPPGFEEVFTLPQGEITQPIRSTAGWHLIRVLEIRPPHALPFEEVEERIRNHVLDEKRVQKREGWLVQLREAATVDVNDDAVKAFAAENAPPAP